MSSDLLHIQGEWTPGPWSVVGKAGDYYPLMVRCNKCEAGSSDWDYLSLADWGDSQAEAKANANLVSAAPDLAEIVRRGLVAGTFTGHLKDAAQAAYAKALGKEASK